MPGTLALQERYRSLNDPVAELRAAAEAVTAWADHVVVLNGSARRTRSSPGPYDARAIDFDSELFAALTTPDLIALQGLDQALATELWATTDTVADLAAALADGGSADWTVTVDYDDAPTGVAWWVIRYES